MAKRGTRTEPTGYKIDATTKVTVGPAKATIEQIKVGQKVLNLSGGGAPVPKDGQTLTLIWLAHEAPAAAAP